MVRQLSKVRNKNITVNFGSKRGLAKGITSNSRIHSWLPEYYDGQSNRIQRYTQYDQMDMDSDINIALDTIAEFCTQNFDGDEEGGNVFQIQYDNEESDTQKLIVINALNEWCKINKWNDRMFGIVRNVIKYGDQPFIRDPETFVLLKINPSDVLRIIKDSSKGNKEIIYVLQNLDLDIENKSISSHEKLINKGNNNYDGMGNAKGIDLKGNQKQEFITDAKHILHLSLALGIDSNSPFGASLLDPLFKTYKQKELLEDSVIIYRVQRAPERRIFTIDTGDANPTQAREMIERAKEEVNQRRIPNSAGGGTSMTDAQYNPISMLEDYYFAHSSDGKGSNVTTLPGGTQLGEIDDLRYFTNKMLRALRIPPSYISTGLEDNAQALNNGKVGSAYIQEFRFNKFCQRIQNVIEEKFNEEFKTYLKLKGHDVDDTLFDIRFMEPQSFSQYREIEMDNERIRLFKDMAGIPFISKRFAMRKWLGFSDEEFLENEKLWREENLDKMNEMKEEDKENLAGENPEYDSGGGGGGGSSFGGGSFGGEEHEAEISEDELSQDIDNIGDEISDSGDGGIEVDEGE